MILVHIDDLRVGLLTTMLGGNEHVHVLIRPLELLICGEESQIRDKALKSAEDIVSKLSDEQIVRHFVPLIHKLAVKDWYFDPYAKIPLLVLIDVYYRYTARSSAASLVALIFARLTDKLRTELLSVLSKLSADDTAAVRKAVAKSLPSIVRSAPPAIQLDMVELLKVLAKDEQDSIRIQIIPASAVFASVLSMDQKVGIS